MNKSTECIVNRMRERALRCIDAQNDEQEKQFRYVIDSFCDSYLECVIDHYGPDDESAINETFNDYTDMLCKNGEISEETYNTITFDFEGWE